MNVNCGQMRAGGLYEGFGTIKLVEELRLRFFGGLVLLWVEVAVNTITMGQNFECERNLSWFLHFGNRGAVRKELMSTYNWRKNESLKV